MFNVMIVYPHKQRKTHLIEKNFNLFFSISLIYLKGCNIDKENKVIDCENKVIDYWNNQVDYFDNQLFYF